MSWLRDISKEPTYSTEGQLENVVFGEEIGEGAVGRVYEGRYGNKRVAIKQLKKGSSYSQESLVKQAKFLKSVGTHVNVAEFLGFILAKRALVFELCTVEITQDHVLSTLKDVLKLFSGIDVNKQPLVNKIGFIKDIARGLQYLHCQDILHGDLKPQNILISGMPNSIVCKLTDFGSYYKIKNQYSLASTKGFNVKGTAPYMAPEICPPISKGIQVCAKTDIYSLAVTIYEILLPSLEVPWEKELDEISLRNGISIYAAVKKGDRPSLEKIKEWYDAKYDKEVAELLDLIKMCWCQEPSERPCSSVVLSRLEDITEPPIVRKSPRKSPKKITFRSSTTTKNPLSTITECQSNDSMEETEIHDGKVEAEAEDTRVKKVLLELRERKKMQSSSVNDLVETQSIVKSIDQYDPNIQFSIIEGSLPYNGNLTRPTFAPMENNQYEESLEDPFTDDFAYDRFVDEVRLITESSSNLPDPSKDDIMRWTGYANNIFNISNLAEFQVKALNAWKCARDCLLVQSTSSGKSLCFQLPAVMEENKFALIIVPTTALAEDQATSLRSKNIACEVFSSGTNPEVYHKLFNPDNNVRNSVSAMIMTPEKLFGTQLTKGMIDSVSDYHKNTREMSIIALDEAHLIHQWGKEFRGAFDELETLRLLFPDVPIMALTATLPPAFETRLTEKILREPVVLKGTINRPNVDIDIAYYPKPFRVSNGAEDWEETAIMIKDRIGCETAIVYTSFAKTCDQICLSLIDKGVTSAAFYGKNKSYAEKKEIHTQMMNGSIQVLVATEAYGLGVNLSFIRVVLHIGVPPNMSIWLQALGRAGRDGQLANAIMLVNEHYDMQKLYFWLKDVNDMAVKKEKEEEFRKMLSFVYSVYNNKCLRKIQMAMFNDKSVLTIPDNNLCCTGCRNKLISHEEIDVLPWLVKLIEAFTDIATFNVKCVAESKLSSWVFGCEDKKAIEWWKKWMGDNWKVSISGFHSFGCFHGIEKMDPKVFKIFIRQLISEGYIDQVFLQTSFSGRAKSTTRFLAASSKAVKCQENKNEGSVISFVDHSSSGTNFLLKPYIAREKNQRKNNKGTQIIPAVKQLLKLPNDWEVLCSKLQYEFLGYHHDTNKLLYIPNVMEAPGKPLQRNIEHYLWTDINISKGQSHPTVTIQLDNKEYIVNKAGCKGVKKCGNDDCDFTVSTKFHINKCMRHEDEPLILLDSCEGTFVYVYPKDNLDCRRWLGFLSKSENAAVHTHPCPGANKPGSKLEEMVKAVVERDPTKKTGEIHKGYGMECMPAAVNLVGASQNVIATIRRKFLIDHKEVSAHNYIKKFVTLIRHPIDEKDDAMIDDDNIKKELRELTTPYRRGMINTGNRDMTLFMTPQMSSVMSVVDFLCGDVTFPDVHLFKYLLNITAFNFALQKWQVTARVIMTSLSASAYAEAFNLAFSECTKLDPEFQMGDNLVGFVVDFSDAQAKGFEVTVGEQKAAEVLRGCRVHWMRQAQKQSDIVTNGEVEKLLFLKICKAIPDIEDEDLLKIFFEVISGAKRVSHIKDLLPVSLEELELENNHWSKCANWVKWWNRPRHVRMFTKCMKKMTNAEW